MPGMNISTSNIFNNLSKNIRDLQGQVDKSPNEVLSNAKTYSELSSTGKLRSYINIENQLDSISSFKNKNILISQDLIKMSQALKDIRDVASGISNVAVGQDGVIDNLPETIAASKYSLASIQSYLNTENNGRYSFAGSRTDMQPVGNLLQTSNILNNIVTSNYYSGDDYVLAATIDPDRAPLDYGITAANPAFQKLIAGINYLMDNKKSEGSVLIGESMKELDNLKSDLDNKVATIIKIDEYNSTLHNQLSTTKVNDSTEELGLSMMKFAQNMAALQASYMIFSKISQMSLAQYL